MSIAEGISSAILPLVQELDIKVISIRQAQLELQKEIERLTTALQVFISTSDPPILEKEINRLNSIKKRLNTLLNVLKKVQQRLKNCEKFSRGEELDFWEKIGWGQNSGSTT
ncbi:hypothetical protein HK099_001066 [Clydaea vesicula]|uniref:Biogenesis of lysosome-related organelles complex 1 subunit 7 n=1 Tax=Clydaea vesicula TaxID=447962 RepID=A0AAD5U888_9FUNG|nr:hypothetical protein HK099_001066 [Clydaea vesicula]KAJ3392546.1 hypothetical protein HDU92_008305 [Lobulomyces angularis]